MCGILVRVSTHPTTDSDEAFASGLHCRGPDGVQSATRCLPASVYVSLTASLLQLRGLGGGPVQPLRVSSSYGSLLAFNGEIFGGLPALDSSPHANDGSVLLEALCGCDDEGDVVALLGALRGPWALAFYCATTGTLWFGRDAFGRRSLLLAADNDKSSLLLSSLAPPKRSDVGWSTTWAELPPGVYSLRCCGGGGAAVRHHGFGGGWLASSLFPFSRRGVSAHALPSPPLSPAERVLAALSLAVARRVCGTAAAPLLVLFSGGLDSTLLALLAHAHAPPAATICLSSVCFSSGRSSDRAAALDAASELASLAPHRHWVLLPIDVTPEEDAASRPGVRGLIYPCSTAMDENIGTALLFAARAKAAPSTDGCGDDVAAAASARVALLGTGADELCGGYGRHRSAWGRGGAAAARAEMDAVRESFSFLYFSLFSLF